MHLDGQAAIVTGGASGLGAATAQRLARAGCRVAVLDINQEAAEASAQRIGGIGIACDVADAASAEAAVAKAREAHGPARLLVNCAGVGTAGRIVGRDGPMPLAAFERVIRINLIGSFNLLRLAAADMGALEPTGRTASAASSSTPHRSPRMRVRSARPPMPHRRPAWSGMTLPAARELARVGVRVVTIAPGLFHTPMVEGLPAEAQQSLADSIPFPQRLGAPEEYAALVEHIVANRFLNGETIRLDGALRMPPR